MTTVLPIAPRTPGGLLAALCLSPVLAPLNASHDLPSIATLPDLSLYPTSTLSPTSRAGFDSTDSSWRDETTSTVPVALQIPPGSEHRLLSPNEARQLTLLMSQYFLPAHGSSKGTMQAAIELAEVLHESGIRWDKQRRVMGTHIQGIWEQGLKLVGGEEHVVRLARPGPMDLCIQNSLCSITDEPHPIDPSPLGILLDTTVLSRVSRMSLTTDTSLFQTLPGVPAFTHIVQKTNFVLEEMSMVPARKGNSNASRKLQKSTWSKRKNLTLKVYTGSRNCQLPAIDPLTALTAMTAISMMSVSELRWHFLKRARYHIRRVLGRNRPIKARRRHVVEAWEMR